MTIEQPATWHNFPTQRRKLRLAAILSISTICRQTGGFLVVPPPTRSRLVIDNTSPAYVRTSGLHTASKLFVQRSRASKGAAASDDDVSLRRIQEQLDRLCVEVAEINSRPPESSIPVPNPLYNMKSPLGRIIETSTADEEKRALAPPDPWEPLLSTMRNTVVLLLGTYMTTLVLSGWLDHWEWCQMWRYTWPFGIGLWYVVEAAGFMEDTSVLGWSNVAGDSRPLQLLQRSVVSILALGVIIGGAYDVWMPVYMTGPNVVTAAGIGQDAAVGLFGWTLWQAATTTTSAARETDRQGLNFPMSSQAALQVLLLTELYKLGEGSFDELFFNRLFGGG